MKGDFSRQTFDPKKHYSAVLMQQGRVQVDADWNEQQAINRYSIETEAKDVIGKCGAPKSEPGFEIDIKDQTNLKIGEGRYYVDGVLCENYKNYEDEANIDYHNQPYLPNPPEIVDLLKNKKATLGIVYLDVWQRHITPLDDPQIQEIALGEADTATRSQTVWQVKVLPVPSSPADVNCCTDLKDWNDLTASSTGKLKVQTAPLSDPNNPCLVPPSSGYQRLENQLYRVEIHHGSDRASGPTFKWSRENGSVVAEITKIEENLHENKSRITVAGLGRDEVLGFASGQWVEIINDELELKGQPGQLKLATVYEANSVIEVDSPIDIANSKFSKGVNLKLHPKIRRWDQNDPLGSTPTATEHGIKIDHSWQDLEGGIEVQFSSGTTYKTGDYWLIPARGVTDKVPGEIEWPRDESDKPREQLPLGIEHHYCRLALIKLVDNKLELLEDCRRQFPPLTEIGRGCCLVTVGKGGDYDNIQEAVDAVGQLQKQNSYDLIKICILPGRYQLDAPVVIEGGKQIIITGCDRQARIFGPSNQPAFQLNECHTIIFDLLQILVKSEQEAILVNKSKRIIVTNCFIRHNASGKGKSNSMPSVSIQAHFVRIRDNVLDSLWIRDGSQDILIQDNEIGIRPSEDAEIALGSLMGLERREGAEGAGIALGNLKQDEKPLNDATGVSQVRILGNNIEYMSNSGISTVAKVESGDQSGIGDVQDLTIAHNRIFRCAREKVDGFFAPDAVGGIVLREVAQVRIYDNYIAENGVGLNRACGIFIYDCEGLNIANNTILDNGYFRERACIYFLGEGTDKDNPWTEQGVSFLVKDHKGNPEEEIIIYSEMGLSCRDIAEIELPSPVTSVSLKLQHEAKYDDKPEIVAFDGENQVASKTMSSKEETLTLSGSGNNKITKIVITTPRQNETLLLHFCFGDKPEPLNEVTTYQAGIVVLGATSTLWKSDNKLNWEQFEQQMGLKQQPAALAASIHDNVVVCPQGQALILLGSGGMSISGNTLTSQSLGQQPPVGLGLNILGRCVAIGNSGVMSLGSGFATVNLAYGFANRVNYNPSIYATQLSQFTDGRVMFHDNQVTLRAAKPTEPLVSNAVALISFDDISLQDNQILSEIAGKGTFMLPNGSFVIIPALLIDVFTFAPTIRASGNRFSELPLGALLSYGSWGWANSATGNQANHCLFIQGLDVINMPNQIWIKTFCPNENEVDSEESEEAVRIFSNKVAETNIVRMEESVRMQTERSTRSKTIEARLRTSLGENHPQVVALREAAAAADSLRQSLETTVIRMQRRPQITTKDWLVLGTVSNSNQDPVAGVRVRLFDNDGLLEGLLSETQTDEYGDFALVYHESDLTKWLDRIDFWQKYCHLVKKNWQTVRQSLRGNFSTSDDRLSDEYDTFSLLPDLYLKVNDAADKQLYVSPDSIRYTFDQIEFFDIRV